MVFALYAVAEGAAPVWGPETHTVTVAQGQFDVLLGETVALPAWQLNGDLWLDITVNGEHMTPRERITETPYAFEARSLAPEALAKGRLTVNGNLYVRSPDADIYGIHLDRRDAANRWHTWTWWHMNTQYGENMLQLYEYRTDSTGTTCGGNEADGAVCSKRIIMWPGGDMCLGCQNPGAYPERGRLIIESPNVPLMFKETDTSGAGSLWRMPVDGNTLRFDVSQNGTDWYNFKTAFSLSASGTMSCGALAEANLLTPEERAGGGAGRFTEGDLLCWGIDRLELCALPGDRLVQAVSDKSGNPIVIGAEPVKVLGPVQRGDILVASSVPGYAMVDNDPLSGSVIAQALEDFDGERGIIKAMIRKF